MRRSRLSGSKHARRSQRFKRIGIFLCFLAFLPVCFQGLRYSIPTLRRIAEKTALVSAALTMPEGGFYLLEQRFNAELDGNQEQGEKFSPSSSGSSSSQPSSSQSSAQSGDSSKENVEGGELPPYVETPLEALPDLPEQYRGTVLEETFTAKTTPQYLQFGAGSIRNDTTLSKQAVLTELENPLDIQAERSEEPQVLIFHTHATEAYEPYGVGIYDTRYNFRSTEQDKNMIAVGDELALTLEAQGIRVIHDTTLHDYPSYNGGYDRSAVTVKSYLEQYPSIKVVLDVHRDGIQRDEKTVVSPVVMVDGRKAAQLMIISGCDDGTMNMPNYYSNLRFAAHFQDRMESLYPGLTRPIMFCYRKYNMDLSPGALLLEFGSHGNTLDEARYTARLAGDALGQLLISTYLEQGEGEPET